MKTNKYIIYIVTAFITQSGLSCSQIGPNELIEFLSGFPSVRLF